MLSGIYNSHMIRSLSSQVSDPWSDHVDGFHRGQVNASHSHMTVPHGHMAISRSDYMIDSHCSHVTGSRNGHVSLSRNGHESGSRNRHVSLSRNRHVSLSRNGHVTG